MPDPLQLLNADGGVMFADLEALLEILHECQCAHIQ